MIQRLKNQFTLVCTALTALVLLGACLVGYSLSRAQLLAAAREGFDVRCQLAASTFTQSTGVNHAEVAALEEWASLTLFIYDNGTVLPLPAQNTDVQNSQRATAQAALEDAGMAVDTAPGQNVLHSFSIPQNGGQRLCKWLAQPLAGGSWYGLLMLDNSGGAGAGIAELRALYALVFSGGLLVLFCISRLLAARAVRPAEEAQRTQAQFIASASHELKSPLAVIRSSADLLQAQPGHQPARHLAAIGAESRRMGRLVDDLLLISAGGSGKMQLQMQPTHPEDVLAQSYENFLPLCATKNQRLQLVLPNESLATIPADEGRLVQLLSLLLDNAHSYTPPGGEITLGARQEAKRTVLYVQDNGPGVPQDSKKDIFDGFYRTDKAHGAKQHYGLGLSVAVQLCAAHGARLWVEDTPGGGATFCVSLPQKARRVVK